MFRALLSHPPTHPLDLSGSTDLIYRTQPYLAEWRAKLTIYNESQEERSLQEVSDGSVFLMVSLSVFMRGNSRYAVYYTQATM